MKARIATIFCLLAGFLSVNLLVAPDVAAHGHFIRPAVIIPHPDGKVRDTSESSSISDGGAASEPLLLDIQSLFAGYDGSIQDRQNRSMNQALNPTICRHHGDTSSS